MARPSVKISSKYVKISPKYHQDILKTKCLLFKAGSPEKKLSQKKSLSLILGSIVRIDTWRSVRSDVQLSCTETQFQKCSQSGKNGSKHPMLSTPMADNVISCKKIQRNTQKIKMADFNMWIRLTSSEMTKQMDHSIVICSKNYIGVVYFGCYLVNPHVQTVQNMCAKGGYMVF